MPAATVFGRLKKSYFWGRRAGFRDADGNGILRLKKYKDASSNSGKQRACKLVNVNKRWFK
jgi:hypothetical protein